MSCRGAQQRSFLAMPISLTKPGEIPSRRGPAARRRCWKRAASSTVGDLLSYLPFRYEDRIRFTPIAEIIPGQVQTIFADVTGGGGTVRFKRRRRCDLSRRGARRFRHGVRPIFSRRISRRKIERRAETGVARQSGGGSLSPGPPGDGEPANGIGGQPPTARRRIPPKSAASFRSMKRSARSVRACCAASCTAC